MIDGTPPERDDPHVVLAHDWLVGLRGGEWVLDRLARLYGPTTIYTLVAAGPPPTEAIGQCSVVTSLLQRVPGAAGRMRRHYLPLMPMAVNRLRVEPCDLLLSTSSGLIKSVQPPDEVPHLCYCHSPARYLWEQSTDYARGAGGRLRAIGLGAFGPVLRRWDRRTAERVTRFLANSRHTAARIERSFGREAHVVWPPVRTEYFTPDPETRREDWWLVVAALEPYKRTDLAIAAAARGGRRLRVVGTGTQEAALRERAGTGVKFLGRVEDDVLRDLYRRARGLLFPQTEDFGIVAVEAQATGCPIVAFAAGGALDIVAPGTGLLLDEQRAEAIAEAMHAIETQPPDPAVCRTSAERFGEAVFDAAITSHVDTLLKRGHSSFSPATEPASEHTEASR